MPDKKSRSISSSPAINVTPLIDVLLVLLIIFMVIQPQREARLQVEAPEPAKDIGAPPPEMLMLTISADWQLALNTKPITLEDLLPKIARLMEERAVDTRSLFIKAPPGVSYASIVLLIDLAKGAGVVTVGLLTSEVSLRWWDSGRETRVLVCRQNMNDPPTSLVGFRTGDASAGL